MAHQSASTQTLANYVATGFWTEVGQIPHSFDTSVSNVISVNLQGLDAAGRALARAALDAWEAVANISFQEVTSGGKITFDDNQSGAFSNVSYYGDGTMHSAHVNVSTSWLSSYGSSVGTYVFQTYMHEIGHALGLGHTGAYNGSASFETDAKFSNDSWQQSLMSYFDQHENTAVDASYAYCLTPMTADILAIQQLYGAATGGATAGHTVYGVGSDLGSYLDRAFDASSLARNAMCISDAGGVDTINFGDDTQAQHVKLAAGTFSSVYGLRGNVGIALKTTIENYVAGSGGDRVIGNAAANKLSLGAGNDTAAGGGGNDALQGGYGNDFLGGGGGNDLLSGGAGNDRLVGNAGVDKLTGGAGADLFIFRALSDSVPSSTTRDLITDFARGYDELVLSTIDAKAGVSGNQDFALDTNGTFSAGEIRQKVTTSGLLLEFNTDGDSTAEMAILLQGLSSRLTGTDFVL